MSREPPRWVRLVRKPWKVLAFRGRQECRLAWMERSGGWDRLTARTAAAAERGAGAVPELLRGGLVSVEGREAFRSFAGERPAWRDRLAADCAGLAAGRFGIFDQPALLSLDRIPWSTDWRHGHSWPATYFRRYGFYETQKAAPYDVKWPWELSRMGWLLRLLQFEALGDDRSGALADRLLADFELHNPVAHSVNWVPMEASVRGITLALAASVLAADPAAAPARLVPWLRALLLHGEFVSRTVEWSDVNNNHYVANLAALTILGRLLAPVYPPAKRWWRFGEARLWQEVLLQFHPDGVNYEMATGYHRLVSELCLLTALLVTRRGGVVPDAVRARLAGAARYTRAIVRPDGWIPAIGDNDSSRLLSFDGRHTRDPAETIVLGEAVGEPAGDMESAARPWLFGNSRGAPPAPRPRVTEFAHAGIVVVRSEGSFLFVDLGDVGMQGRGGHGHNDALGFELALGDEAVVVDRGTPGYTADLARHREARSTASHSVVGVDGEEQAPLHGPWRTGNDAQPLDRVVRVEGEDILVSARHEGYARLADPVSCERSWEFAPGRGRLRVVDRIRGSSSHRVERRFHLAPGSQLVLEQGAARLRLPGGTQVRLTWNAGSAARVEEGWVADSYGTDRSAPVLVLEDRVSAAAALDASFALEAPVSSA